MTEPEKPELSNEELKPCPWCGEMPTVFGQTDAYRCEPCMKNQGWMSRRDWNRRSQEAPQGKSEWSLEVEDARTLAAYWLMTDERSRREMWQSDIKKICEQLLKATEVQSALSGGGDERWNKR